jgi:hypothetical protein
MKEILLNIFTIVDDFCLQFLPALGGRLLNSANAKNRGRHSSMSMSEIMTILLAFQLSNFRHFKGFFFDLKNHYTSEFPNLVSYSRFVSLIKSSLIPLVEFFEFVKGIETDSYFIDSTTIAVCKNKRIFSHRVFKDRAARGKSTMGWFFGFKLHLICNQKGDPIDFRITPGNQDDRVAGEKLMKGLRRIIVGDKGYISKELFNRLFAKGLRMVTSLRKKSNRKS